MNSGPGGAASSRAHSGSSAAAETSETSETVFDAIVIGSGMSGLTTASLLAQIGKKRVLVLESHFKLGGFLHGFRRHGYEWDPGVHYVGAMGDGELARQCMDLVTGSEVQWNKLDHHFEELVFPEFSVSVPSDPDEYRAVLKDLFPDEAEGIDRYFKDVKRVQAWATRWVYSKAFTGIPAKALSAGRKLAETLTQDYLDANFTSARLKAALAGQWADYGTPPDQSPMGVHGLVVGDFASGGYFPVGGSQKIIDAAVRKVEEHGGRCFNRHRVTEILIENNRAYGVEAETRQGTKRFFAPIVVSAAGLATTFNKLVGEQFASEERATLTQSKPGPSATVLFLGLNDDPRKHGFRDCNYWVYDDLDHNGPLDQTSFPPVFEGGYLSIGSLRDPSKTKHSAQLITFSDHAVWDEHEGAPWRKRGDDYEQMKREYAESFLAFMDERLPGLRDLVEYYELSTPLTVESLVGHPNGEVYGPACTLDRLQTDRSTGTSVRGLHVTGTDLVVPGVNAALMIGVMAAGRILRPFGVQRILHRARAATPSQPWQPAAEELADVPA